jgi:hypothetical protein
MLGFGVLMAMTCEKFCLLRCIAVESGGSFSAFRRNLRHSRSGSKNKPSKRLSCLLRGLLSYPEYGCSTLLGNVDKLIRDYTVYSTLQVVRETYWDTVRMTSKYSYLTSRFRIFKAFPVASLPKSILMRKFLKMLPPTHKSARARSSFWF